MHVFLNLLIVALMLAVLAVLIRGVVGLFKGMDARRSNKLMQYRVLLQGLALLVIFFLALVLRR